MDKKYVLTGLGYAIVGLLLGIYMAATKNHIQLVTHAHIMLLGFVVSFIYAVIHKLWLIGMSSKLAKVQFYCHQIGAFALFVGLFLLYGEFVADDKIGPFLGVASVVVFVGMVLMKVMFIKYGKNEQAI